MLQLISMSLVAVIQQVDYFSAATHTLSGAVMPPDSFVHFGTM